MNPKMTLCLWFDDQAEEAALFYTSVFTNSALGNISRFGKEGFEYHGKEEGTAMSVEFRLNDMHFIGLNGGPKYTFSEAFSVVVYCDTQEEIDHYWNHLSRGGEEGPCGWLKDRFGVSWQIIPSVLSDYLTHKDVARRVRVQACAFQMKKFNIETLKRAFEEGDWEKKE